MSESQSLKVPVLLDTDIGTDVDDALCLAYLLRQPRCELLGVTTVTGEPVKRAMLVDMICRQAGRTDIPIRPGVERPLLGDLRQQRVPQAAVLDRWPHAEDFPRYEAVQFMRDTIESRPGEVTLLAVGPMTNVALLFALYPETAQKLKALVMMCGGVNRREWNSLNDPTAMAMVYQTRVSSHITIGVDVTLQCVLERDRAKDLIRGGILDPVAEMGAIWLARNEQVVFHDPLAAVSIFEPDLCEYLCGTVSVELQSQRLAGYTYFDQSPEGEGPHKIAVKVNAEGFFEHYFKVVKG